MNELFWLGSEQSYHEGQAALARVEDYFAKHPDARAQVRAETDDDDDDEKMSPIMQIVDGVAIINVEGSLYDATFGIVGVWFGVCGYGDIQLALTQAVRNYDVRSILLNIKSGGGSVSGCDETGKLIAAVDAIKPVHTYTSSMMASAALWLGLGARKITAGTAAMVGSIGTLSVVVSRYRQLKEDGIDAVVIRSGKYKALGHPAEELSEAAIEDAQARCDYFAKLFVNWVAERRGTTAQAVDTRYGQGRVFIGQQALDVGLVDAVESYSQAFSSTQKAAPAANNQRVLVASVENAVSAVHNPSHSEGTTMPTPHIPSPAELAAMAAGVDLQSDAADSTAGTPDATGAADSTDLQAQLDKANADLAAAQASVTALVEAQAALEKANADLTEAKTQVEDLTAKLTASDTVVAGLAEIARGSVRTMKVALNASVEGLDSLSADALLALHKETVGSFRAKFKVGGVAATDKQDRDEGQPSIGAVDPLFAQAALLRQSLRK